MKAEELRTGNQVWDTKNYREVKIAGLEPTQNEVWVDYLNGYGQYKLLIEFIDPIPLSPELLVRCGLTKDGDRWEGEINIYLYREGIYRLCVDEFGALERDIKYLHQLQNITYWLTSGTELTIAL